MKIGFNVNKAINAYSQSTKVIKTDQKKRTAGDSIDISQAGREILKYIETADNTELKNDKVDEIQKLIKENNYKVDSHKLATSILKYAKESDI